MFFTSKNAVVFSFCFSFFLSFLPLYVIIQKQQKDVHLHEHSQTQIRWIKAINMLYGLCVCASHRVERNERSTIIKFILLISVCRSYLFVMTKSRNKKTDERKKFQRSIHTAVHCQYCVEWLNYMGHIDDIFAFQLDLTPQFIPRLNLLTFFSLALVSSLFFFFFN